MIDGTISMSVVDGDETHTLTTYPGEYRSLMTLLYDKLYLEDFGECLGMGRCGTCMVTVSSGHPMTHFDRNASTTLEREGISDGQVHLSCQIMVDQQLDGAIIHIYHPEDGSDLKP